MKKSKKLYKKILTIFIVFIAAIYGIYNQEINIENVNEKIDIVSVKVNNINIDESLLNIFYFDVGQADSTLIIKDGITMLIDAGNDEDGEKIIKFLELFKIKKIDYLIATHMHADHIGGLDKIINKFDIGKIYMPKTNNTSIQTKEFLLSMKNKNLKYNTVNIGDTFNLSDMKCEIMYVNNEENENANLSTIVLQLKYANQSYLFMGDAEKEIEDSQNWAKYNVLKVAHHGSNTSSSESFISQVKPEIAIISVGVDNTYGHPSKLVLDRIKKYTPNIYITDELGTIWLVSDGIANKFYYLI